MDPNERKALEEELQQLTAKRVASQQAAGGPTPTALPSPDNGYPEATEITLPPDQFNDLPINPKKQGVGTLDRIAAQLSFPRDSAAQAKALATKGYVTEARDPYGVLAYREGDKEAGVVDPPGIFSQDIGSDEGKPVSPIASTLENSAIVGPVFKAINAFNNNGSVREALTEGAENLDLLPDIAATTPGTGAVIGSATGAARQLLREGYFPETDFDLGQLGLDVAGPIAAGSVTKYLGKLGDKIIDTVEGGAVSAKDAVLSALKNNKQALSKIVLSPEELEAYEKGILNTLPEFSKAATNDDALALASKTRPFTIIKNQLNNVLQDPTRIAAEIGASPSAVDISGRKPITENIKYLQKNVPEFGEVLAKYTKKGKAQAALDLLTDTGEEIRSIFTNYGSLNISVDNILNSSYFSKLSSAATKVRKLQGGTPNREVRKSIQTVVKEFYDNLADLTLPRATIKKYDAGKIGATELHELLRNKTVTLQDAWELRKTADDLVDYFGGLTATKNGKNYAYKESADALRDAINSTIAKRFEGTDLPARFSKLQETYSNLASVTKTITKAAAKDTGILPPISQLYPGVLNTKLRWTAKLLENYSKFTPVKATVHKLGNTLEDTTGIIGPALNNIGQGIAGGYSALRNTIPLYSRMQSSEYTKMIGRKLFRDPDLLTTNPDDLDLLLSNISPQTAQLLTQSLSSRDPMRKEAAFSQALREAPDLFESPTTGLSSEMKRGNSFVITDASEAMQYSASIMQAYKDSRVDANFLAEQQAALNDPTDRRVLTPPSTNTPVNKGGEGLRNIANKFSGTSLSGRSTQ